MLRLDIEYSPSSLYLGCSFPQTEASSTSLLKKSYSYQCYMFNLFTVANFHNTSHLIQNLLKYTVLNGDKIAELKDTAHSILKRLKVCELGLLLQALESRGGDVSSCVFYPCGDRLGKRIIHEPQVILYRTFRQPGIQSANELKPLAVCSRRDVTSKNVCINPYHYSAVVQIELPARTSMPVKDKNDSKSGESSSGFVSNYSPSTSMEQTISSLPLSPTEHYIKPKEWPKRSWCCVAYWEHNDRIGPLFHQYQHNILNIFESLPVSNKAKGLCLAALNRDSTAPDVTKRVRNHIGFGLQLSREEDGIWMYNRSDFSLFANGPTFSERTSDFMCRQNTIVHKVPPGYSLKLYDYAESPRNCQSYGHDVEPHSVPQSVRVSFAKGWGNTSSASYRRQFVTSCPCWVEIHFFV